jgi:hypothetical protein
MLATGFGRTSLKKALVQVGRSLEVGLAYELVKDPTLCI